MGACSCIKGFKPPDEKWHKMKAVRDACLKAKINTPKEVDDFFDGKTPDEKGVEVDLKSLPCCKKWNVDYAEGYEIDVSKLPKDVTIIRAYTSY